MPASIYLNMPKVSNTMLQPTIYPSEKGKLTIVVFAGSFLIILSLLMVALSEAKFLAIVLLGAPLLFLSWLWASTYYRVDDAYLYYTSGPFRGKIPVTAIREIVKNKTLWVGFRPALNTNGLIIRYNKWDEIYISPQQKDAFIRELLKRNEHIQVKQ
jgi:hypothetical protein